MIRVAVVAAASIALISCGSDTDSTSSATTPAPATPTVSSDAADLGSGGDQRSGQTDDETANEEAADQRFPDVIDASAERTGDTWTIAATLSSPYDTPDRYADAWRVVDADGTVYGERILAHDHANEQPFTRSQSGIEIPNDVTQVTIEGRDLENGWGGQTFALDLSS